MDWPADCFSSELAVLAVCAGTGATDRSKGEPAKSIGVMSAWLTL